MATGDTWRMLKNTAVYPTPTENLDGSTSGNIGFLAEKEVIVETGRMLNTWGEWVRIDYGGRDAWVLATDTRPGMENEKRVNCIKWQEDELGVEDHVMGINDDGHDGSGLQIATDVIFDESVKDPFVTYENNTKKYSDAFFNIKHVMGVFGLPYQFLPSADTRLSNSSDDKGTKELGFEYSQKIIQRIPLLFLIPGKANFMTKFSSKSKNNILNTFIGTNGDGNGSQGLQDLINADGRYYTFETDAQRYYQFVNPMCRIAARYLEIADVKLTEDTDPLDSLDWQDFTRSGIQSIGDFGDAGGVPFYVDADTSVSESFSNSTSQSMMASWTNSLSDMGRELNFILGNVQAGTKLDLGSGTIQENIENLNKFVNGILGKGNMLSNLANHLTAVAAGGRLMFPEIWSDSQFSRSYSCKFKFISPDPSTLSIYLNVLVPLIHLLALVAPQSTQTNPNVYANPFLVRAIYKGFFNVDTGIITSMSVTKGAECQWNPAGIPTSIEVDIDIKDLYPTMSITPTTATDWKYDTMTNTALMDYLGNLCGINVFKPEAARLIDMMFMTKLGNRVTDIVPNIFGGLRDKVENFLVHNIYRRGSR